MDGGASSLGPLRAIDDYVARLFAAEDAPLRDALRASHEAGLPSINISPTEGRLIGVLIALAGARRVLEIGTLGGYSAIWIARALPPGGTLVTIEIDPDRAEVARRNLERAGLAGRVQVVVGPALEVLAPITSEGRSDAPFDAAFIDAGRPTYPELLEECLRLVRPGGLILADNVIRAGGVIDPHDADTAAVARFNAALAADPRVEAILVPLVRDGIDGIAIARVLA